MQNNWGTTNFVNHKNCIGSNPVACNLLNQLLRNVWIIKLNAKKKESKIITQLIVRNQSFAWIASMNSKNWYQPLHRRIVFREEENRTLYLRNHVSLLLNPARPGPTGRTGNPVTRGWNQFGFEINHNCSKTGKKLVTWPVQPWTFTPGPNPTKRLMGLWESRKRKIKRPNPKSRIFL